MEIVYKFLYECNAKTDLHTFHAFRKNVLPILVTKIQNKTHKNKVNVYGNSRTVETNEWKHQCQQKVDYKQYILYTALNNSFFCYLKLKLRVLTTEH